MWSSKPVHSQRPGPAHSSICILHLSNSGSQLGRSLSQASQGEIWGYPLDRSSIFCRANTHIYTSSHFLSYQSTQFACLWTMWGSQSNWRGPTRTWGEHTNSPRLDSNSKPSRHDALALTTTLQYCAAPLHSCDKEKLMKVSSLVSYQNKSHQQKWKATKNGFWFTLGAHQGCVPISSINRML